MSPDGHTTCPHCRAIVQSSICAICGKSAFEEVTVHVVEKVTVRWWTRFENHELRTLALTVLVLAVIAGVTAFVLTRSSSEPEANALPPPAPVTAAPVDLTIDGRAPSIADGIRPTAVVTPGAPREVSEGLSPWETAPPIDFVTGLLLDLRLDYTADIARVDELLRGVPDQWSLTPLDPPELLTFDGIVDAEVIEASQPFAARTVRRPQTELEIGQLWLIASSGSALGDAYLAAARARWNVAVAVDQYSPEVGVRLWRLGGDATLNLWAADLDARSMVIIQAPVAVAPDVVTDALRDWRRALAVG